MGNVGLHLEYQVIVIAHHGIGADADGKDLRQLTQLVGNPLASVLVALAGVIILAAEKGAPDTAADNVIVRRIGEADLA
ncbi:hypothetical protein D3C85_1557470 [compost metagenome]